MSKQLPKIALGAWAWGNDGTFGPKFTSENFSWHVFCARLMERNACQRGKDESFFELAQTSR